jgi:hypothetical protein
VSQLGLTLLLAAHLLTVNVASGGPFVCIWLARRARRGDGAADAAGRQLARWSLDSLALGVVLGVALIGLLWWWHQSAFLDALGQIPPRRLAFGGFELLFFYAMMAWYVASWGRWQRLPWMHPLIAIVAGANLVYHFPTLFTVVALLEERGAAAESTRTFVAWLRDPELLARVAHFGLASLAVTGAALMAAAYGTNVGGDANAERVARWGAHLILWPTLVQLPLGLCVLLLLAEPARDALLGNDLWGPAMFALGLLAVLALLQQLGTAVLGRIRRTDCAKSIALLATIVLLMVGARERARQPLIDRPDRPSAQVSVNSILTSTE